MFANYFQSFNITSRQINNQPLPRIVPRTDSLE